MSVPYALYAESSGSSIWEKSGNGIHYSHGKVGVGTTDPNAMLGVNMPAQIDSGEVIFEGRITDAQDDFFKVSNGTVSNGQFIPSVWGHHQSDERVAVAYKGSINSEMDKGTVPVTVFISRIYDGDLDWKPVQNRPLFSWRGLPDDKMTMLANGYLGLGTTKPLALMHLEGKSNMLEGRDMLIIQNNSVDEKSTVTLRLKSGIDNTSTMFQHTGESYQWQGRSGMGMIGNDGQGLLLAAVNDTGTIRFETGGWGSEHEAMRINEEGKVSIGYPDPGPYTLRVETTADGGSDRAIARFHNDSESVGSSCTVYVSSGESGSTCLSYFAPSYIHWGGRYKSHSMLMNRGKGLVFRSGQNDEGRFAFEFRREIPGSYTFDEKVSINYEGNVGIGITNPQHKLHLEGNTAIEGNRTFLKMLNSSNESNSLVDIRMFAGLNNSCLVLTHHAETYTGSIYGDYRNVSTIWNKGDGLVLRSTAPGRLSFEVFDEELNSFTEKMRMDSDGKFGIGTTAPASMLHVNSANQSNLVSLSGPEPGIKFTDLDNGDKTWQIQTGYYIGNNFRILEDGNENKARLYIAEGGNVGIGTVTPERKLHVKDILRLEPRDNPPINPAEGDMYMDATDHKLKVFDGVSWRACW
jgi:hypothetical protein